MSQPPATASSQVSRSGRPEVGGLAKCHPLNRRFYDHFSQLRDVAEAAGRLRLARAYVRVLQSLRRYPLPIASPHDASALEGVGKNLTAIFQAVFDSGEAQPAPDRVWRAAAFRRYAKELAAQVAGRNGMVGGCGTGRGRGRGSGRRFARRRTSAATAQLRRRLLHADAAEARRGLPEAASRAPVASGAAGETVAAVEVVCAGGFGVKRMGANVVASAGGSGVAAATSGCARDVAARGAVDGASSRRRAAAAGAASRRPQAEVDEDDRPLSCLVGPSVIAALASPRKRRCQADDLLTRQALDDLASGKFGVQASAPTTLASQSAAVTRDVMDPIPDVEEVDHSYDVPASLDFSSFQYGLDVAAPLPQRRETPPVGRRWRVLKIASSEPDLPSQQPQTLEAEAVGVDDSSVALVDDTGAGVDDEQRPMPAPRRLSARRLQAASSAPPAFCAPPLPEPPAAPLAVSHEVPGVRVYEGARLRLLLDHREVGAGRNHAARGALLADLRSKLGAEAVEPRALPLGDVLWVWQAPGGDKEAVAGWIVERKTFQDLSSSIVDGRYDEQKLRLLEAPGMQGVVYLIEGAGHLFGVSAQPAGAGEGRTVAGNQRGFGQRLVARALPLSTLSTTSVHTQLITGFHVLHASSTAHTVSFLTGLHRAIAAEGPASLVGGLGVAMVPYREFAERTRKTCHPRVIEAFGRMLRMVPSCGPEATEALVDEFQTPHALAVALRDFSDTALLLRLKARQRGGRAPVTASALAACRELFAP